MRKTSLYCYIGLIFDRSKAWIPPPQRGSSAVMKELPSSSLSPERNDDELPAVRECGTARDNWRYAMVVDGIGRLNGYASLSSGHKCNHDAARSF